MKKFMLFTLTIASLSIIGLSCTKSDDNSPGSASVNFHLTDAPASYDQVNVDVQSIQVQTNQDTGWQTLTLIQPGVYNLIKLRNGADTLLSRATLPAGTISQIRLVLGTENSVVIDGQSHPLATPSSMQSGLKFNFHQTLVANGAYDIWIDFDANKSVVKEGNGSYALKPVIKAYSQETDGQIKGYVLPYMASESVLAISNGDTAYAYPASTDGFFMFKGLVEGNYTVVFSAGMESGLKDTTLTDVNVSYGQVTDLGTTNLVSLNP
ncbi:DUF4382 domain-containing protein [Arachidicoccus terrestris]|uniref:DUF4382 domain-containing protein n=1 Tax=Arachidicoccus terrestris TaxID=2875539 RepID=UPI001CC5C102|nr:DUF4382 domain-containing protein [Arachidicoccus terrestris]UAY55372.1 DUF4382 domain-containing protein [Arachidicoccus terrestris]